jgi:hypothetical protein
MTLHVLKLCVGANSIDDLREWVAETAQPWPGGRRASRTTTRMAPKRVAEILAGGSLYWVIRGAVAARQRVLALEPFDDGGGVQRHHIVLDADVVPVRARPCRAFQGWRYLRPEDAPADIALAAIDDAMPAAMRRDLQELCLL